MLEMSRIIAILQLYSQVADLFGNLIVKHINMRAFDLLARLHYILNLPCIFTIVLLFLLEKNARVVCIGKDTHLFQKLIFYLIDTFRVDV